MVNLGEDHIFLSKGQVVGFLDPECIDISEIELDIATITVDAIENPTIIKEKMLNLHVICLLNLSLVLQMLRDPIRLAYKTLR